MYWCNCSEGWKPKGRSFTKQAKNDGKIPFQQISVVTDDTCPHCGHYAYFSKKDPNQSEQSA